jgi:hypothetical protein
MHYTSNVFPIYNMIINRVLRVAVFTESTSSVPSGVLTTVLRVRPMPSYFRLLAPEIVRCSADFGAIMDVWSTIAKLLDYYATIVGCSAQKSDAALVRDPAAHQDVFILGLADVSPPVREDLLNLLFVLLRCPRVLFQRQRLSLRREILDYLQRRNSLEII